MKKFILLTLLISMAVAGNISKVDIVIAQRGALGAYIYGSDTNNIFVLYNGESVLGGCKIGAVKDPLDRVVRKWAMECKLPNLPGKAEIKYFDLYNKQQSITKFIR